jgi:hypothetical protein
LDIFLYLDRDSYESRSKSGHRVSRYSIRDISALGEWPDLRLSCRSGSYRILDRQGGSHYLVEKCPVGKFRRRGSFPPVKEHL